MQDKVNLNILTSNSSAQTFDALELTDSDLEQISGATGMQHDFYYPPFYYGYSYGYYPGFYYPGFYYPGFWGYRYGLFR
ncbi:hypothetical protein [Dictyobacter aurantiacus]|uniref:Uncharacterized protein n=1 Tax=Dictyobacter aurantiacus TaxID=1936993 RepID=A0A401ZKA3_9CHLR|nr:hypothetical protein [Dictyobacter aurantiacus]GCE07285.1 hypothetical protein KDAU_46140 [Dictyobacter aurantiacus]